MQAGTGPLAATAEQKQTVRGDQQDLEENEKVEQIACQERTVETEQLHLEQHVEIAADARSVQQDAGCQHCGHQHHDRSQPIDRQDDTKGRRPVTETVYLDLPFPGLYQQHHGNSDQSQGSSEVDEPLQFHSGPAQKQQQNAGQQRQQQWKDDQVAHRPDSLPST